jgi:hypothetical protein
MPLKVIVSFDFPLPVTSNNIVAVARIYEVGTTLVWINIGLLNEAW